METVLMVEYRPYTTKELIALFCSKRTTFYNDLRPLRKELGKHRGHRWSIRQVILIFEKLGRPYKVITV